MIPANIHARLCTFSYENIYMKFTAISKCIVLLSPFVGHQKFPMSLALSVPLSIRYSRS